MTEERVILKDVGLRLAVELNRLLTVRVLLVWVQVGVVMLYIVAFLPIRMVDRSQKMKHNQQHWSR